MIRNDLLATAIPAGARLARAVVPLGWFIGGFFTHLSSLLDAARSMAPASDTLYWKGRNKDRRCACGQCSVPGAEPMARCSGLLVIAHTLYSQCSRFPSAPVARVLDLE